MSSSAAPLPEAEATPATRELVRALSLRDAIALVLTVIGTGVFLKTATMAQLVGSPSKVLLVWVVAGLLSLAGALTYAELGAMIPEAGGDYVFLREAYGGLAAFLFGWTNLVVIATGGIAAVATILASFLSAFLPLGAVWATRDFHLLGQVVHWRLGIQQLVAVARAVIHKPSLILADEPTGNLHSSQGKEIMELFTELNRAGTTIVQVTHSDVNAQYGNRVVQLRDGWVVK